MSERLPLSTGLSTGIVSSRTLHKVFSTEGPLEETEIVQTVARARPEPWREHRGSLEATLPALDRHQARIKRCVDVFGAGIGLILLSPLLALLAVLVKFDSDGPILFVQTRVGFRGRPFRMLKLRTMRDGADDEKASVAHLNHTDDLRLFKIRGDPRVTRFGQVMRRWSLDELPQLYNVLVGEMSLVGPRPFFESDLDDYEAHHFRRLSVLPGLTGLWQISGRSDVVDFDEVVRLDRHYIEDWSLALDLRILLRTIPTVVGRRGAY